MTVVPMYVVVEELTERMYRPWDRLKIPARAVIQVVSLASERARVRDWEEQTTREETDFILMSHFS